MVSSERYYPDPGAEWVARRLEHLAHPGWHLPASASGLLARRHLSCQRGQQYPYSKPRPNAYTERNAQRPAPDCGLHHGPYIRASAAYRALRQSVQRIHLKLQLELWRWLDQQ